MREHLLANEVRVIAFDHSMIRRRWYQHHDQLLEVLRSPEGPYEEVRVLDVTRKGEHHPDALRIYRLREPERRGVDAPVTSGPSGG